MALLIDGYNLIHGANILGRGVGPRGLERARLALLEFLVASLSEADRNTATVVFDAENAPPGLPRMTTYQGVTVRFSAGYRDADELIEELIGKDSAPRKLTVVSSDHRLHKAARRRKATAIDSDIWYAEMLRRRAESPVGPEAAENKPPGPVLSEREIERLTRDVQREGLDKIFPPGYGEDLKDS